MSEDSVTAVREAAEGLTRRITRDYWLQCAREGRFPTELWEAMAETGLLGVSVPEEYGGSGGGLSELMVLNEITARAGIISLFFVLGSSVGLGNRALDKEVSYRRERPPFGQPIGSYQDLQHPMARHM